MFSIKAALRFRSRPLNKAYGGGRSSSTSAKANAQQLLKLPLPNSDDIKYLQAIGARAEIRQLRVPDKDACTALENAAFQVPEHRCSAQKLEYRLSTCAELCFGVFGTIPETMTGFPASNEHLLAHIIGIRTNSVVITDAAMDYPRDNTAAPGVGHQPHGRTIAIHSLASMPDAAGYGLGRSLLTSFLRYVRGLDDADRISLICQKHLIDYYTRFGFVHLGPSKATFGGGGWHDMTMNNRRPGPPLNEPIDDEPEEPVPLFAHARLSAGLKRLSGLLGRPVPADNRAVEVA